ncbi:MAG: hypothetical protein NW200_08925 [Hyphomonadaceae bacterium]|nr:hypothetical protein [Hyphomonadaceae bacterium]
MQIDQTLRRLVWRARRRFIRAADHDPVVTLETPAPTPPTPASGNPWGRRLRTALAFVATLATLALGYGALVAFNSRAPLEVTVGGPPVQPGESNAVAAVVHILAYAPDTVLDEGEILFVPSGRSLRESMVRAGATSVAAAYIARAGPLQGRLDAALADARAAMAATPGPDRVAARDALRRFNDRLADGEARLDAGPAALAGLLRAAADACDVQSADLAAMAAQPSLLAAPAVDARMAQARGVAWGWALILRGALRDAPDLASTLSVEASIPLEAMGEIAERQPLFLFNVEEAAPFAPAHVAEAAAEFARAAAGARALASALDRQAP